MPAIFAGLFITEDMGKKLLLNRAASGGRVARFSPALDVVAFDGLVQVRADQKPSLETKKWTAGAAEWLHRGVTR